MMEEQAREELELLEAQYPNQYEYLKHELKSFIFELESKHTENSHFNNTSLAFIDTEESTSLEQIKRSDCGIQVVALAEREVMEGKAAERSELESSPKSVAMKHYSSSRKKKKKKKKKRKDRVDLVLERAQKCLKKIQHLKASLLSPS